MSQFLLVKFQEVFAAQHESELQSIFQYEEQALIAVMMMLEGW